MSATEIKYSDDVEGPLEGNTKYSVAPYIEMTTLRKSNQPVSISMALVYLKYFGPEFPKHNLLVNLAVFRDIELTSSLTIFPEISIGKLLSSGVSEQSPLTFGLDLPFVANRSTSNTFLISPSFSINKDEKAFGLSLSYMFSAN